MRDDFEPRVRVAEERARCRRDLDALAAFRVRHDDALDVLDDVAGRRDRDGFRQRSEHLARLGRRERDGDRLRAAHRRHELAAEDFEIRGVERAFFFHVGNFLSKKARLLATHGKISYNTSKESTA